MIPNLALSRQDLLEVVEEVIDDPSFLLAITHPIFSSIVLNGKLYWNLGHSQGYVVTDPKNKKIYRVYDINKENEPLSNNSLCDPATAQMVLDNVKALVHVLDKELAGIDLKELLLYFPPLIPTGSNTSM